jgi:hypothetical protein
MPILTYAFIELTEPMEIFLIFFPITIFFTISYIRLYRKRIKDGTVSMYDKTSGLGRRIGSIIALWLLSILSFLTVIGLL